MDIIKCLLTQNDCYKTGQKMKIKGFCLHSTGANNPNVRRYVQPADDDPNAEELLSIIGINRYQNDWNHGGISKCVHAFCGYLADGSVGIVQTLPWDMRGWHAGTGTSGRSANDGWISMEVCEDGLSDATYFNKIYTASVELVAMLCKEYNLDPLADGVVICHKEAWRRGIASNHIDVEHWFPKFGKTMDDFRQDVADKMGKQPQPEPTPSIEEYNIISDTSVLNIRKGPGTNYAVIGQIKDKKRHVIIAESTGQGAKLWGQLKENNGWIALDYTHKASNGYVGQVIAKSGLNVRSGPATTYPVVRALRYGSKVSIEKEQDGWGQIDTNQWVNLAYIKKL